MHGHLSASPPAVAERAGQVRRPVRSPSLGLTRPAATDAVLTMQRSVGNAATSKQRPLRIQRQITGIARDAGTPAEDGVAAKYNQQRFGAGHALLYDMFGEGDPIRLAGVIRSHQRRHERSATGCADQEWVEGAIAVLATFPQMLKRPRIAQLVNMLCAWMYLPSAAVNWVTKDNELTCDNAQGGVAMKCLAGEPKPLVRICSLPTDNAAYLAFAEAMWRATVLLPPECAEPKPNGPDSACVSPI